MTPMYQIAEGNVPGRPRLRGATVQIKDGPVGEVIHEDPSGVMVRTESKDVPVYFPFNYQVLQDAKQAAANPTH